MIEDDDSSGAQVRSWCNVTVQPFGLGYVVAGHAHYGDDHAYVVLPTEDAIAANCWVGRVDSALREWLSWHPR